MHLCSDLRLQITVTILQTTREISPNVFLILDVGKGLGSSQVERPHQGKEKPGNILVVTPGVHEKN